MFKLRLTSDTSTTRKRMGSRNAAMKYEKKYLDAEPGISPNRTVVKLMQGVSPCASCGEVTRWFHLEMILFTCSEECTRDLVRIRAAKA